MTTPIVDLFEPVTEASPLWIIKHLYQPEKFPVESHENLRETYLGCIKGGSFRYIDSLSEEHVIGDNNTHPLANLVTRRASEPWRNSPTLACYDRHEPWALALLVCDVIATYWDMSVSPEHIYASRATWPAIGNRDVRDQRHYAHWLDALVHFPNVFWHWMPRDAEGTLYALNPIFEMAPDELEAVVYSEDFDYKTWVNQLNDIMWTRLESNAILPLAHSCYQSKKLLPVTQFGSLFNLTSRCQCCDTHLYLVGIAVQNDRLVLDHQSHPANNMQCPKAQMSESVFSFDIPTGNVWIGNAIPFDFKDNKSDTRTSVFHKIWAYVEDLHTDYGKHCLSKKFADHHIAQGFTASACINVYQRHDQRAFMFVCEGPNMPSVQGYTLCHQLVGEDFHYAVMDDRVAKDNAWLPVPSPAATLIQCEPGQYLHFNWWQWPIPSPEALPGWNKVSHDDQLAVNAFWEAGCPVAGMVVKQ